jgi:pimeloyl-ACP methyl ester carboxylesterase
MANSKTSLSLSRLLPIALSLATLAQSRPSYPVTPKITWSKCPGFSNTSIIDCGEMQVPLAYFDTTHGSYEHIDLEKALQSSQTITLGMARLKATGPKRLGTVIMNPGGPGGAGSEIPLGQAAYNVPLFGEELTAHYDVIGYDPRGVGMSTQIKCDPDLWNERASIYPTTEKHFEHLISHNKKVGASCEKLTGPLLRHLDTVHVVHDLELIRRALGEGKLNYLGLSYGTQIGSQYAEFFPGNVGRMALDGLLDHSQSQVDAVVTEATTLDRTVSHFFDWCAKTKTCALHGKDAAAMFDKLIDDADKKPIPAKSCKKDKTCRPFATGQDIRLMVQNNILFVKPVLVSQDESWVILSKQLAAAMDGDASGLSYSLAKTKKNSLYAAIAVGCQDWLHTEKSVADTRELITALGVVAPHMRGSSQSLQTQMLCLGWPAPVSNPQHLLNERAKTAPPMLMVNAYWDPSTSIVWANGLKKQLPAGSSLVLRNGSGHTSYYLAGEASKVMDKYLVTGKLPKDGSVVDS